MKKNQKLPKNPNRGQALAEWTRLEITSIRKWKRKYWTSLFRLVWSLTTAGDLWPYDEAIANFPGMTHAANLLLFQNQMKLHYVIWTKKFITFERRSICNWKFAILLNDLIAAD